jgi:hypothetical protein
MKGAGALLAIGGLVFLNLGLAKVIGIRYESSVADKASPRQYLRCNRFWTNMRYH